MASPSLVQTWTGFSPREFRAVGIELKMTPPTGERRPRTPPPSAPARSPAMAFAKHPTAHTQPRHATSFQRFHGSVFPTAIASIAIPGDPSAEATSSISCTADTAWPAGVRGPAGSSAIQRKRRQPGRPSRRPWRAAAQPASHAALHAELHTYYTTENRNFLVYHKSTGI